MAIDADRFKTINNNVKAQTEENGCIKDGQLASYVRCSMENKNLLQNKYDIYVGTGNYITTGGESVSRETDGMNIIDAINGAAVQSGASAVKVPNIETQYIARGPEGGGEIVLSQSNLIIKVNPGDDSGANYTFSSSTFSTGQQIVAGSFNALSDARLKINIKDFNYHDSILNIPVREYDWKESGEHTIGFIAQELQEIYPELVGEDEDGKLYIKETKLIYLLIEEVKALKKEIEELKKEG